MRRATVLLFAALLGLLAACSRVPDAELARRDLAALLAERLPAGLLTLDSFRRLGSAADGDGRFVYYTARLKLDRDHDFGRWSGANATTLAALLGTGSKGIDGLKTDGNHAGDALAVSGVLRYRDDGGTWKLAAAAVASDVLPGAAITPAPEDDAPPPRLQLLLGSISEAARATERGLYTPGNVIVEEELEAAWTRIRGRLARSAAGFALAGGPVEGEYWRLTQALARAGEKRKLIVQAVESAGSIENLRLLEAGTVQAAIVQGDVAARAHGGHLPVFTGVATPYATLRSLGALYPEELHVVVRADSPLRSLADLRGRRVELGAPVTGTRFTVDAVLDAHGLAPERFSEIGIAGPAQALEALRQKRTDAVFLVIGAPAAVLTEAGAKTPLRLLPLEAPALARLDEAAGYRPHTLPAGLYPGQDAPVATVSVAALLLTTTELPDNDARTLRDLAFAGADYAAAGSQQGPLINPGNAGLASGVPLHAALSADASPTK